MSKEAQTKKSLTVAQKAQELISFARQGAQMEHSLNTERITLNNICEQEGAHCFKLKSDAGVGIAKENNLVPGTELFKIIEKLPYDAEYKDVTVQQKQMIMLVLMYGLFCGAFKKLCNDANVSEAQQDALTMFDYQKYNNVEKGILLGEVMEYLIDGNYTPEEKRQRAALCLVGGDVKHVRSSIVQVLGEKGQGLNLTQRYHEMFDMYNPQRWGSRKSSYDRLMYDKCAKWCSGKDVHKKTQNMEAEKDYMLLSLAPKNCRSLLTLMHSTMGGALNPENVNNYFTNYHNVHDIRCIFEYLYNDEQNYLLGVALEPWVRHMRTGMRYSHEKSNKEIARLQKNLNNWQDQIGAFYTLLPKGK